MFSLGDDWDRNDVMRPLLEKGVPQYEMLYNCKDCVHYYKHKLSGECSEVFLKNETIT